MKKKFIVLLLCVNTLGIALTAFLGMKYGKETVMFNMEQNASAYSYSIDMCSLVDAIESESEMDIGISAPKEYSEAVKAQLTEPCTVEEIVKLFLATDPGYAGRAVEKFGVSVLLEK